MSDNEFRVLAEEMIVKGVPSWYYKIYDSLTEKQQSDLDEALADRSIFPTVIAAGIKRWGYDVSVSQVQWHRKRNGL